jgi:hypothetical protein
MDNESKEIGRTIFNLQRLQILQIKCNPQTARLINNDYAYAWQVKMFPLLSDGKLHEDLEKYFTITKKQVEIITKRADSEWLEKRLYNFYEYESYFEVRGMPVENIDRWTLICVFRYMYLQGCFDDKFWEKLLEPTEHPMEAASIIRKFSLEDLFL